MKPLIVSFVLISCLVGCKSTRLSQKTGSDLVTDDKGRTSYVTYVSAEEYQRMTPQERERTHATIGVEATAAVWGTEKPKSEAVTTSELDRAMKKAKADVK